MKADIYHVVKTSGSISMGWLGKYRFSGIPKVGDYIYDKSGADIDKYIVTEVQYRLKRFGRTEIMIQVERETNGRSKMG